jgi:hypothetical protein
MRFRFEHVIDGPLGPVERALLHPGTLARLPRYAPLVGSAELLDRHEVGGRLERTARFRAAPLPLDVDAPGLGPLLEQALVALIERQFAGEARLLGDLARAS